MNTKRQPLIDLQALHAAPAKEDIEAQALLDVAGTGKCVIAGQSPALLVQAALDGHLVQYISNGSWSMHDLFTAALNHLAPAELYLSTFSITEFSARILAQAMGAGRLTGLHMLLDYRSKVRYPEVHQLAENVASRIRLTPVHAKVMVVRAADGRSLTCIGSANWTENPRIEAGMLTNSPEAAGFHTRWLNTALEHGNPFN